MTERSAFPPHVRELIAAATGCEHDDPWCKGPQMLAEGRLPCLECLHDADEELLDEYNDQRSPRESNSALVERGRSA